LGFTWYLVRQTNLFNIDTPLVFAIKVDDRELVGGLYDRDGGPYSILEDWNDVIILG